MQKAISKMYVFMTVTLLMSISKRRIQCSLVIANVTSNKISATSKNFHSPIILGHDNSYNILWYIEYRVLGIPRYIDQKNKKTGSFINFSYQTVCFHFRIWTLFISNVRAAVIFRISNSKVVIWIPNIL